MTSVVTGVRRCAYHHRCRGDPHLFAEPPVCENYGNG
jgi:hypothetical protein